MNVPQEAIEAAYNAFQRPNRMLVNTSDGALMGRLEAALEAVEPFFEKQVRAKIAAELRGELPVQLAETAGSNTGWLSDVQYLNPNADEDQEFIDFAGDNGYPLGSIDISHIAEHAAKIAEGENK